MILISGQSGFIGQAITNYLKYNIVGIPRAIDKEYYIDFFRENDPEIIIHCAAYGNHYTQTKVTEMILANILNTFYLLESVEMYTNIAFEHGWIKEDRTQRLDGFTVFNSKYFYPYYFNDKFTPECMTEETHAVHHWAGTWTKDCYK